MEMIKSTISEPQTPPSSPIAEVDDSQPSVLCGFSGRSLSLESITQTPVISTNRTQQNTDSAALSARTVSVTDQNTGEIRIQNPWQQCGIRLYENGDITLNPDRLISFLRPYLQQEISKVVTQILPQPATPASTEDTTQRLKELEDGMESTEEELEGLTEKFRNVTTDIKKTVADCSNSVADLQIKVSLNETRYIEKFQKIYDRLGCPEGCPTNGILYWKVDKIKERIQAARMNGQYLVSNPFYTSIPGYLLCMKLYLNGNGAGKDRSLSLYLIIMKGKYGELIKWPFTHKVYFYLLNQIHPNDDQKHIHKSFLSTENLPSCQKPTTDMNSGYGCPEYFPLDTLNDTDFVRNDCLYIKAEVKKDNI